MMMMKSQGIGVVISGKTPPKVMECGWAYLFDRPYQEGWSVVQFVEVFDGVHNVLAPCHPCHLGENHDGDNFSLLTLKYHDDDIGYWWYLVVACHLLHRLKIFCLEIDGNNNFLIGSVAFSPCLIWGLLFAILIEKKKRHPNCGLLIEAFCGHYIRQKNWFIPSRWFASMCFLISFPCPLFHIFCIYVPSDFHSSPS